MSKEVRWKQRLQNFETAFLFLEQSVTKKHYDDLQKAGLVQCFEFSFESAWKSLKDYLESVGMPISYPRDELKESFKSGLIVDGHTWIDMLDKRNELSHAYNKDQAKKAVQKIRLEYYPAVKEIYLTLKKEHEKTCSD